MPLSLSTNASAVLPVAFPADARMVALFLALALFILGTALLLCGLACIVRRRQTAMLEEPDGPDPDDGFWA